MAKILFYELNFLISAQLFTYTSNLSEGSVFREKDFFDSMNPSSVNVPLVQRIKEHIPCGSDELIDP